jgi:pimeloyl-ACP methyl ester carboxylesterase
MIAGDGIIEAAGQRLEARWIDGNPDKPVILMLHEGLGSLSLWRDFPDQVAARTQCPVLVWSRAGYGKSDPVSLPRPLSYMHDEAIGVLPDIVAQLEGRAHVLLGHSDGASIALIHAGHCPQPGLKGLVLMAPHVFVEDISIAGIEAAREAWQQGDLRDRLARHHGHNVDCAFRGWNDAWLDPGFRSWNLEDHLPGIRVPTLLIQGRGDEYGTLAQIDAIAAGVAGPVSTCILDSCGHSPQKDQTAAVLDAVSAFMTELQAN